MSLWSASRNVIARWIDEAAVGFAGLITSFRRRRRLRLIEGGDETFTLERERRPGDWESLAEGVTFSEGALASALTPRVRSQFSGADVDIALEPGHFVNRSLELPARAAEFLGGVVRAQIDRLTPWKATEACFGVTAPTPIAPDRIGIRIVVTPRARLEAFVNALAPLGPDSLKISTHLAGELAPIPVLSETLGAARRLRGLRTGLGLLLALAAIGGVAALIGWSVLGLRFDSEREDLESAIAQRRAALMAKRGSPADAALAALEARKRAALPAVLALESLSGILPDNSYLTEMHLEDGKIDIGGVTNDAPALIRLIEQSHQFTHAAFSTATTRSPTETGERFHIEAAVEPNWIKAP